MWRRSSESCAGVMCGPLSLGEASLAALDLQLLRRAAAQQVSRIGMPCQDAAPGRNIFGYAPDEPLSAGATVTRNGMVGIADSYRGASSVGEGDEAVDRGVKREVDIG